MIKQIKNFFKMMVFDEQANLSAIRTMRTHNNFAFEQARLELGKIRAEKFRQEYLELGGGEPDPFWTDPLNQVIAHDDCIKWVKENYGYAQLKDFGEVEYVK